MQGICKSLRIKERQLCGRHRVRQPKRFSKAVAYRVDPTDPRQLILANGCRLRQAYRGVCLYVSPGGHVYTLTRLGLRPLRVDYCRRNNYGKKTANGVQIGRRYPYIMFRNIKYEMHVLMAYAWHRRRKKGEEIDHINGDIDDFRRLNIRVVTKEENNRCGGILKRLRAAAIERNDPTLNPLNMQQKDLLEIFRRLKGKNLDKAFDQEVERYRTLVTLRHAAIQLHDPSINPDNMSPKRREMILNKYRVDPQVKLKH